VSGIPASGPVLALDFGSVRTGVAVSDPTRTIARPLDAVERASSQAGMSVIAKLVAAHDAVGVVVGLPVGLRGPTAQTQNTISFVGRLRAHLAGIPVVTHDERFTSRMADHTRRQTGSATSRDSLAACHLLTDWMQFSQ
jgi:putative Holliday junction resolvase